MGKLPDEDEILSKILYPEELAVSRLWYDCDNPVHRDINSIAQQLNITPEKAMELARSANNVSLNIFEPPIYRLLPEERAVFELRNGFYGDDTEKDIITIAKQLHITLDRARELESSYKQKLREEREPQLSMLSSEEKTIIKTAYGLEDGIFKDIDTVATQLLITPQKVKELTSSSMQKLRQEPSYPISKLSFEEKSIIYSKHGHKDGILKNIDAVAKQLNITPKKARELEQTAMEILTGKTDWAPITMVFVDGIVAEFGD